MLDGAPVCHGVLLEIDGQGVLLQGESGIGKSDLALALVRRGHRLVADDGVAFERRDGRLLGRCRPGFEGYMEIHGLGLIDLQQLYGEAALVAVTTLDLVLQLDSAPIPAYDGLRPVSELWALLGIEVPAWRLPCTHQRDMPLIVETAMRLNRARQQGYDASDSLQYRLTELLRKETA